MQGLNMLGGAYQLAKGAFPLSLLFNAGSTFSNLRGGHPTQNAYEQARNQRRLQSRIDYMKQRRADDLTYSPTNLANLLQQTGQQDDWVPPIPPASTVPGPQAYHQQHGGGDRHGGGQTQGQRDTARAQRDDPGLGGHKKGGRVNFSEGGLASLWI